MGEECPGPSSHCHSMSFDYHELWLVAVCTLERIDHYLAVPRKRIRHAPLYEI